MSTATLPHTVSQGSSALGAALYQRLHAWLRAASAPAHAYATRDTAATLYARAARYESTQPGFAADLRAAAEALDRSAATPR